MRLKTPIEDGDRLITEVKIATTSAGLRVISSRAKKRKKNGDWYADDWYDYSHREIPAEHWPVILRQWAEQRMDDADIAEQRAYDARQDAADARRLAKELEPKPMTTGEYLDAVGDSGVILSHGGWSQ